MRLRTSRRTSSIDHNQMTCPSASEKCSAQVCPPATHGKGEGTVPARLAILTEHRTRLHSRIDDLQLALAATDYKIALYSQDMDGTDGGATNPAKGPADADAASRRLRRGS